MIYLEISCRLSVLSDTVPKGLHAVSLQRLLLFFKSLSISHQLLKDVVFKFTKVLETKYLLRHAVRQLDRCVISEILPLSHPMTHIDYYIFLEKSQLICNNSIFIISTQYLSCYFCFDQGYFPISLTQISLLYNYLTTCFILVSTAPLLSF